MKAIERYKKKRSYLLGFVMPIHCRALNDSNLIRQNTS